MTVTTDPNTWIIYGLVFLLGLLVGVFLTTGGRRKWRTRYQSEVERRRELEKAHLLALMNIECKVGQSLTRMPSHTT